MSATGPDIVAVVTARGGSRRIPLKNLLPVGGIPIALRSVLHGLEAELPVVLSTDLEELVEPALEVGAVVVTRPPELAGGNSHAAAVRHAVAEAFPSAGWFVLLQPTSPFREDSIVARCVETWRETGLPVRTIYPGHLASRALFDGSVLINRVRDGFDLPVDAVAVENSWINSLQIDFPNDYRDAVKLSRLFD